MSAVTAPSACLLCGATPRRTEFGIYHPWSEHTRCSLQTTTLQESEWVALMNCTPGSSGGYIHSKDKLPTKDDANRWGTITAWCSVNKDWLPVQWINVASHPESFIFWRRNPPRPSELTVEESA